MKDSAARTSKVVSFLVNVHSASRHSKARMLRSTLQPRDAAEDRPVKSGFRSTADVYIAYAFAPSTIFRTARRDMKVRKMVKVVC